MKLIAAIYLQWFSLLLTSPNMTGAFSPISPLKPRNSKLYSLKTSNTNSNSNSSSNDSDGDQSEQYQRRYFLKNFAIGTIATTTAITHTSPVNALVKGNAPPPKKNSSIPEEKKCVNVEECQEMAERLATKQEEEMRASMTPAKIAPLGTRYRDLDEGSNGNGAIAKTGDVAMIYYKVLKLGKRSYDGLSGEGTVVFSRGYGLEDDEKKIGDKTFTLKIGDPTIISALNDALPGMTIGSTRRINVLPQMGWRKPGSLCDGGPGGSGQGGELKTDYVVVPTATMVATETCFDKEKKPFPTTYAEQRRMAQRFDQSLIFEVQLVGLQ